MSKRKLFYKRPQSARLIIGSLIVFLVLFLDQVTKSLVLDFFNGPSNSLPLTSFFSLTLGFNPGVSFGMLSNMGPHGPQILSAVTGAIIAGLCFWAWRSKSLGETCAFALIIGGALGNLYDRVLNGVVTDFLDFHFSTYHWPAFNLADTAIFVGAGLLVILSFRSTKDSETNA